MLFTGWEVCIEKNCARGLECTDRGRKHIYFFRAANVKKLQANLLNLRHNTRADRLRDVCRKFILTVHNFHQFEKVEWNKLV